MSKITNIFGFDLGRAENDAVNFSELEQDEPEKPVVGELGRQAISEMYYQLSEFEEELDRGIAA